MQKRLQEIRNRCNRRGIIKRDAERRERDCGGELSLIAFKKNVQLFHGEIAQSKDCGYGTDEKRLFHSITFFRRLKVEALLNVFHASKDKDGVLAGETGVRCYIEIDGAVVLDSHDVDVVFCVPAIDIVPVVEAVKESDVNVGAENLYFEESGAYTGEISPNMLVDAGVKYVIIGHSERREYFAETDETVNKKVLKAFEHDLTPIICCGETLTQRKQGIYVDWIRMQIKIAFQNVTADQAKKAVIAYEPIWAIGTGETATADQAEEVCAAIRACIGEIYDAATADAIRIQYGGSMNAKNAAELLAKPDIDGGLIGGASLKPDFGQIVNA